MDLGQIVSDFANALCAVDASGASHKAFQPGIGPFGEADAVRHALNWLKANACDRYSQALIKQKPDLLIPGLWQLEFKIARPFGDNGRLAEHWSENLLHPYPGNTSLLGDCFKLSAAPGDERRAVIAIGYEHDPAVVDLENLFQAFELLANSLLDFRIGPRYEKRKTCLVHPVHQIMRIAAWEVPLRVDA